MLAPGAVSARAEILERILGFFRVLRKAPSHEVVTAALLCTREMRTTLAQNIAFIEELTGLDVLEITPSMARKKLVQLETVSPLPEDIWRMKYLGKLMQKREELHVMGMEGEKEELQGLINSLCIS